MSHEEKETDVNIALKMVSEAVLGNYETAILVSGDSDLVPAFHTIRELMPKCRLGIAFPPHRRSRHLAEVADFVVPITRSILLESLFEYGTAPSGWVPIPRN